MSEILSLYYNCHQTKHLLLLSDFNNDEFSRQILKNTQIPNFMTIRPVGADIFHADGHVETNSQSPQFYESA
jgi:hypothetical protein